MSMTADAPLAIATSLHSSASVLEGLAKVCSPQVLEHVATNPNTPPHILKTIAVHPNPEVRVSVAENRRTPLECIWALALDENSDVRFQLAENHALPASVLEALSTDENPFVACRAQRTIARLEESKLIKPSWKTFRNSEVSRRVVQIYGRGYRNAPITVLNRLITSLSRYTLGQPG